MRVLRGFVLCLLLLMGAALTNAQDTIPLLEPVNNGANQMRAPLTSPQMVRARYVAFNPQALTRAASVGSQITLNLFDDVALTATTLRVDSRLNGQGGYVWYGEIPNMLGAGGVMVVGEDLVTASFFTPQGHFTIEREASGFYRVTQLAPFENPTESDAVIPPAPPANAGAAPLPLPAAPRATGGYVDVLVLVTPAARDAIGNMDLVLQRSELMVAIANLSRMNSGVTMQLRLVQVTGINYQERINMNEDLYAITDSPAADALRNQYGADLVTLITKDKGGNNCGLAWVLNGLDNVAWRQKYGYNVLNFDCLGGTIFAHESGHNMGGLHDHANAGSGGWMPFAYGYQNPQGKFATVMAYATGGTCTNSYCDKILYFSTPKLRYLGRPIGKADWADMTRLLNMTSSFVASFRAAKVTSTALPAFDLVSPVDMTELASKNTVFSWSAVAGATHYQLNISNAAKTFSYRKFINASACSSICSFDTTSVTNWNPPAIDDLTWRVKALDSVYQKSSLSTQLWTLKTRFLPKPLIINTPLANEIVTMPQVTFTWPDDARVEKFRMQLFDDAGNVVYGTGWPLADETLCPAGVCTRTVDLTALTNPIKEGAIYRWRVEASSSSVAITTFSGRRPFMVDVMPPNITPISPANQEIVPTRRPVFTWARAANVAQYRFVYKNSAKQLMTAWLNADTLCDASACTLDLNTQTFGLPLKVGEWFVQGRIPKITGVIRSPSLKINIVLP